MPDLWAEPQAEARIAALLAAEGQANHNPAL